MCLSAVLGIGSSIIGASSANKAAKRQAAAAREDLAFQKETRDLVLNRLEPYNQSGKNALGAYEFEMGLGERPTIGGTAAQIETIAGTTPLPQPGGLDGQRRRDNDNRPFIGNQPVTQPEPTRYKVNGQTFNSLEEAQAYANANKTGGTEYKGYSFTPDYQFRLEQGQDSVNAMAGAKGGLLSGRTLQDLSTFNQGLAAQGRNEYMQRLGGLVDTGMSAAGMAGNASQNAAAGVSNALSGIGNAGSAGAIGFGNAITGGLNNLAGLWQYQKAQQPTSYAPSVSPIPPRRPF